MWGNLAIFVILGIIAFAMYSSRREAEPPSTAGAGGSGDDASRGDWTVWLVGGVAALGGVLLLSSPAARRNWGAILGTGFLGLALLAPVR